MKAAISHPIRFFLFLMPLAFFLAGCGGGSHTGVAVLPDNFEILVGDQVTVDGTNSTGTFSDLKWSIVTKPDGSSATLTDTDALTPQFIADKTGDYTIQLSVNDDASSDVMTITAKKVLAKISIGDAIETRTRFGSLEYAVNFNSAANNLSGSESRGSVVSYTWEQVAGPAASADGPIDTVDFLFDLGWLETMHHDSDQYKWQVLPVSLNDARMIFRLTVTDADGNTDTDHVVIYAQDEGKVMHPSSGLNNVPIKAVVYLSGPSLKAVANLPSTDITDWTWTMTRPTGSDAYFADSSSLTSTSQFPKFTPDIAGIYTITYASTSAGITTPRTLRINAADWVGIGEIGDMTPSNPQCATCHNGAIQEDKVSNWKGTKHATIFENNFGAYYGQAPEPSLWEIHSVGYNTDANNNGFDDLIAADGFSLTDDKIEYANFTHDFENSSALANVQCESCHGPGSGHSGDPTKIAHSFSQAGTCGQCHAQEEQWKYAAHNSTGVAHGSGSYQSTWTSSAGCVRCHTAEGFTNYLHTGFPGLAALTSEDKFPGVTCAACHDPHDATNDHQLRLEGEVTMLVDNSTVNAGKAAVCYTCHDGVYNLNAKSCDSDGNGSSDAFCLSLEQIEDQASRGVHYNPQAPVLEGRGAILDLDDDGTNDVVLTENSFHSSENFKLSSVTGNSGEDSINNKCVTCHMAFPPAVDSPGYLKVGGHAIAMRDGPSTSNPHGEEDSPGALFLPGNIENIEACTPCHLSLTTFNRPARADYDGNGTIDGVQTEFNNLMKALAEQIVLVDANTGTTPPNVNTATGTLVDSGTGDIIVDAFGWAGASSTAQAVNFAEAKKAVRRAVWIHNMLARDGSHGVHNFAYAVQLIQKTYTALATLEPGVPGIKTFAAAFPNATLR